MIFQLTRQLFLIALLLGIQAFSPVFAQQWSWGATSSGSTAGINNRATPKCATDAAGNTYVTGTFTGSMTFGNFTVSALSVTDFYVAKLAPTGQWQWAIRTGGIDYDGALDIKVDSSGAVFVAGIYSSNVAFGTTMLSARHNGTDLFVACLSPQGQWQWVVSAGGDGYDYASTLAFAPGGDILVGGNIGGQANTTTLAYFGSVTTQSINNEAAFVARLSRQGQWRWAVAPASNEQSTISQVAVDAAGNTYVLGTLMANATFGSLTVPFNTGGWGGRSLYIAQLSPQGQWQWVNQGVGDFRFLNGGLVAGGAGEIYITGNFTSGAINLGALFTLGSLQSDNFFVAALSSGGQWRWLAPVIPDARPTAILADGNTRLAIGGYYSHSYPIQLGNSTILGASSDCLLIADLDTAGHWQWGTSARSTGGNIRLYSMAAGPNPGAFTIAGTYFGSATFGASTITSNSAGPEVAIARLGSSPLQGLSNEQAGSPSLTPNPATDVAILWLPHPTDRERLITIHDQLGRLVLTARLPSGAQECPLPISTLAAGLYVVRCDTLTHRLVVP